MTLYGYADNSPPGTGIAHPCIHSSAGGVGTYSNPITFATDVNELGWCQIIYVPYMKRYFIHEDECSECDANWNASHLYRFDMWAGGDAGSRHQPEKRALRACESTWTRADSVTDPDNPTITIDPPSDLPVTTAPIFSGPTTCWTPIAVSNPGKQTSTLGTALSVPIHAVDESPSETLAYQATGLPERLVDQPELRRDRGNPHGAGAVARDGERLGLGGQRDGHLRLECEAALTANRREPAGGTREPDGRRTGGGREADGRRTGGGSAMGVVLVALGLMAREEVTDELCSLVVVAEDIRDGRRQEPFSHDEIYRLCNELRRAIALLSSEEGDLLEAEDGIDL